MEQLMSVEGECSFYENVKCRQNRVVRFAEFVTAIRNGHWRTQVEEYRRLKEQDRSTEAECIKKGMPGVVVAGVCEGGHSKANFRQFSGLLMIDIDHHEGDIGELKRQAQSLPWVKAVWTTISGRGIKVVIRVNTDTKEEYEKQAYPVVARAVSRLLEVPVDMQCRDLSRMCYASFDPEVYWTDDCLPFPWREELAAEEASAESAETSMESGKNEDSEGTEAPQGLVACFLDRFIERHPFVRYHRHDFLLKLGRAARRAGMNEHEFRVLVNLAVSRLEMPDLTEPEIRRDLTDAYVFESNQKAFGQTPVGFKAQKVHPVPADTAENDYENEEETSEHNREMRLSAPYLPDWIFDSLPSILTEGLVVAKNRRQRDMLFLSMIVNLSACMPKVKMSYDDTDVYPHLFLAVVASSASGKGIMTHAGKLAYPIQKMIDAENARKMTGYEEAVALWNQEMHTAMKEKRKPDMQLRPEPVQRKTLIVPADVSRTQLIQLMSASPNGVLLNVSEMDTLRSAMNTEYGKFDDLMRACFHHEMFGSDFKSDKQSFMVYSPRLAFCASGTPNQFYSLCPSLENGAYSRYLIYMAEQDTDFRKMEPGGEQQNRNQIFLNLSGKVLEMYRFLNEHPTEVKLTKEQWDWHWSFYRSMLQGVMLEGQESTVSVVFRHGLNTARLAMILTTLRKFDERWAFHDLTCSADDFRIVMAVMEVLLTHSLTLSTSLRKVMEKPAPMRYYFRVLKALETLKSEFRYSELIDALVSSGLSLATSKRIRSRLLKMKIIVQEEDTYRFVHRKWRKLLQKEGGNLGTR